MAFDLSKLSSLFNSDNKPKGEGVIGVDIGSSSIKIVQLRSNKGVPTLDTYGELQLGPYGNTDISRPVRLPTDKLTEALTDILREAGTNANQAVIAISYNSSFITIISVPETDPDKVRSVIAVEARKYVPVALSDVSMDWFPIPSVSEEHATKVLIAAIHNEALTRYASLVKGAKLLQIGQEIEIFSTIRAVLGKEDTTVAIIDVGAVSTKFFLIHKGILCNAHSVSMNGLELTNTISRIKNIDFKSAEEEKRAQGFGIVTNNPELEKAFTGILERGFREMHTLIKQHETAEKTHVEKVILTGGGALLNGLVPYMHDIFNCPVVLANPFSKVAHPAFLEDTLKEAGPSFTVAIGAALQGLQS